jgi:hypothetical protein
MVARSRRELRKFGITVGGVFLVLGCVSRYRGHELPPLVLWTLGTLLFVPGLIAPAILGPVERGWMRMAAVMGHVNTRIILSLLYFALFVPFGFVLRRFRDPLDRSLADGRDSNWIKRVPEPADRARYQQQF